MVCSDRHHPIDRAMPQRSIENMTMIVPAGDMLP